MQIHLNTYGAYLHVKDQLFEIRRKVDGEVQKHHLAAHKVKSIWVNDGVALSSDAVKLAMKHNVDIVFLEYDGQPYGRVWHSKLGSTTLIRKKQLVASMGRPALAYTQMWLGAKLAMKHNVDIVFLEYDGQPYGRVWHSKLGSTTLIRKKQLVASMGRPALAYTQMWLGAKLANQCTFLHDLKKHRAQHQEFLEDKISRISKLRDAMMVLEGEHIREVAEQLRGLEGTAGRLYFETLSYVLPRHYQFSGRSFRPAADAFNAFLNYAYGILYSRVEKALIIAGLDPYLGFLHRDDYNHKSMVYDFIEPYRILAEEPVFRLFAGKKVRQDHVDELANGFRLNQEGKVLLIERLNKHLEEEKIRYKGRNQSRINIIQFDAHQLANELIENIQTP